VCAAVLLAVVAVSTLVMHLAMERLPLADSLYWTIAVATGSDMPGEGEQPAGLKVFVSFLRVFGMALTAAFTAIVTNYLLRARLGGALEVRRVPERGHLVVCGLGNVGFRVTEELARLGERVVVLELARDSRFVTTVRRMGVAVIHGDATVREVLRQANAATARAVLAVTSNDLVNLETALLVRELNPEQRVVVRLGDPRLEPTLREAANIRLAFSVSALAAPAFVAALFGDRVQDVFFAEGRLLAVIELVVEPEEEHFAGQALRAAAVDYRFLPVALSGPDGAPQRLSMNARLAAGSRVLAVVALPDLERLVSRRPAPREWAVEVTSFTLASRDWAHLFLRTQRGLSAEEAERALAQLPACAGADLTRGQAEDLLAQMARERVAGRLRPMSELATTPS
jgi:Trk K+ transport system NAD-binding subunit